MYREWAVGSDGVVIAKVDADAERSLGERFGIQGFPTLKWFPKGSDKPEEYDGGRTADGVIKFINDKTGERERGPRALNETGVFVRRC